VAKKRNIYLLSKQKTFKFLPKSQLSFQKEIKSKLPEMAKPLKEQNSTMDKFTMSAVSMPMETSD
jgi:hypothetical protein